MNQKQLETLKTQLKINHDAWQAFMEYSEHSDLNQYHEQVGQNFALTAIRYILQGDFEKGMQILGKIRNKTGHLRNANRIKAIEKAEANAKENERLALERYFAHTADLTEGGDA